MVHKYSEKGQALIFVTFAMIALVGFAALAIDGGEALSDRRHAQNAADTAAYAAALAKVKGGDWDAAGRARATSNGYTSDGTTVVEVYLCNNANATCTALPTGAKPEEYVNVKITSHVRTTFARVIGRDEVINRVSAVAHAVPGFRTSIFGGNALVSLNKTACSAMEYKGSSTTTVTGSGIFVNSDCGLDNPYLSNQAFNANTGSGTFSTPCMSVVGGITTGTNTTLINPGTNCTNNQRNRSTQITDPAAMYKKIAPCGTAAGTYTSTTLNPGNYNGAFPPGGQTQMNPGVYCIDAGNQGFSLSGGQTLSGNGVLIYMKSGNVSWSSGGVNLSAMQTGNPTYDGLLLYLAPGNCDSVSITGNGTSSYVGTILAPCSNVKLAGGSSTGSALENQIISDTITLTGSNTLNINFNASEQWQPPVPPAIEMNQ